MPKHGSVRQLVASIRVLNTSVLNRLILRVEVNVASMGKKNAKNADEPGASSFGANVHVRAVVEVGESVRNDPSGCRTSMVVKLSARAATVTKSRKQKSRSDTFVAAMMPSSVGDLVSVV